MLIWSTQVQVHDRDKAKTLSYQLRVDLRKLRQKLLLRTINDLDMIEGKRFLTVSCHE